MPGRSYTIGNGYRYSINGQENTPEIAPNTTTAEFWQYDARIVRRWNVDPKSNVSISPYNCFAGNPIMYVDILGDTLDIGGVLTTSKDDIQSLAKTNNQKYISFGNNNRVTLNFSGLSASQQQGILKNDKGLSLIKDIIDSDKRVLYEATDLGFYSNSSGGRQVGILRQNDVNAVKNTSNFGTDSQGGFGERPRSGYDGHLMVDTKTTWEEFDASGTAVTKPRNSMVFHELAENYYRTHYSINYQANSKGVGLHKIGAHQIAINLEQKWQGTSNSPGGVSAIKNSPASPSEVLMANRYNHIYQTSGFTREDFFKIISNALRIN